MRGTVCAAACCVLLLLALCVAVPDGHILWTASDALYTGEALAGLSGSIQPYGAALAASAVLAWGISLLLAGRKARLSGAANWLAWALGLGMLLSRLLYCAVEPAYYNPAWFARLAALRIWDGGMAMTGALLGMLLACRIVPGGACLAPTAMPLFVMGARLAEGVTQLGYGPSVELEGVLARPVGYAIRLNVSLLEAGAALVIFACALLLPRWAERRKLRLTEGKRLAASVMLYGISQIFMESLRKDRHMIWGFTKVQQILVLLLVLGALLALARDGRERKRAIVTTLCAAVPLIALEFALDRADVSIFLLYGAYLLILAAYLLAAWRMFGASLPDAGSEPDREESR